MNQLPLLLKAEDLNANLTLYGSEMVELHRDLKNLPATAPFAVRFNRWVLEVLVVFMVITQVVLAVVISMGAEAHSVLPLTGGAALAIGLLAFYYSRWLLPVLSTKQLIVVLLFKEIIVFFLIALVLGLMMLLRWLLQ